MKFISTVPASQHSKLLIASCVIFANSFIAFSASAGSKTRLAEAETLFKHRCTNAGERVLRTVKDVEGISLLKVRPPPVLDDYQYRLDDPYGRDAGGVAYIESFLKAKFDMYESYRPFRPKYKKIAPQSQFGYYFVDVIDQDNKRRTRYTGRVEQPGKTNPKYSFDYFRVVMESSPALEPAPRYAVTYDDISSPEDRAYWIAGSSLKIIDLQDGTVIAERIGYLMDKGQGASGGGRLPWLLAAYNACPAFPGNHPSGQSGQTNRFVEKVLVPKRESKQ